MTAFAATYRFRSQKTECVRGIERQVTRDVVYICAQWQLVKKVKRASVVHDGSVSRRGLRNKTTLVTAYFLYSLAEQRLLDFIARTSRK